MQSGLPVCAISFPTLPELVRHGENGFIFQSPLELKDHLFDLLIAKGHERVLEGLRKVTSPLSYLFSPPPPTSALMHHFQFSIIPCRL